MCWTGRAQGHLGLPRPGDAADAGGLLEARRAEVVAAPWSYLHQVHGAEVHVVRAPGAVAGVDGDALVTNCSGAPLAVFTADCGPVALASDEGVIALVHAGWRGLLAGVVERAVAAMAALGATKVEAALGPCIRAGCYPFGEADLDAVAEALGDRVRARTAAGDPALDLPAAVEASLERAGARLVLDVGACTACSSRWFSHRANGEAARQATLVWIEEPG